MTTNNLDNEKGDTSHASHQSNKRMNADWFRQGVTDYLTVSSISYPKGTRATVTELDENNIMVDVMYYKSASRSFHRNGRQPDDWIIQLYVESDDFQDATADSTCFASILVQSKHLVDAIKPALSSVNYPLPENTGEQIRFFSPFHELFFAQGRLLETLKYAGLGAIKERQLRAFILVMQVVLKKLNHTIRDLAGKKVIDFDNLWTLFPQGSFAVTTINSLPHIAQVTENAADLIISGPHSKKKDTRYYPFKFSSFEFDGINFGTHQYQVEFYEFKGHSSISSLEYRPLKFEERFEDSSIVQKAVDRGRKSLDYQSFHYCQYTGRCHALRLNTEPSERDINGRVVVDAFQVRKNGVSYLGFLSHNEHAVMPIPAKRQEIYNSMRPLFLSTMTRRPTVEEQEKRKNFFRLHEEYLMLVKPVLPVWSLDHNDWFWADISKLEPVTFSEDSMSSLVDSASRQLGLLNVLINQKLNLMLNDRSKDERQINAKPSHPLVVCFSGAAGTGKTATAQAIAESHQRPLMSIGAPAAGTSTDDAVIHFSQVLENAASWRAIVLFDDAHIVLGANKKETFYDQTHLGIDLANSFEQYRGIIFLTKRDDRRLVHDILKRVQAHIDFNSFDAKKRERIWRKLLKAEGAHLSISPDTVKEMSEWDLNGHDIKHLYNNIDLMFSGNGDEVIDIKTIEELKDLTLVPKEEWSRWRSRSPSRERVEKLASASSS